MTYVDLIEEAEELAEIWGYSNTLRKPNWNKLVNQGYIDLCWETDAIKGPAVNFTTTADTAEYDLKALATDNRDWKYILDLTYNAGAVHLRQVSEAVVRREDPLWSAQTHGQPTVYWPVRPNVIRLHRTPSDSAVVFTVYGVRSPIVLAADTDVPAIPLAYHLAIPARAAYLHAKKYAKSDQQLTALKLRDTEFQGYVEALKAEVGEAGAMDGFRWTQPVDPDRIYV